jgi:hypothetical protein
VEIRKGERWRCQNRICQAEILVLASSELPEGTNPRCSCGQIMRKPYARPEINTSTVPRELEQQSRLPARSPLALLQARRADQN